MAKSTKNMDKQKLEDFLEHFDLRNSDFSDLVGVTTQAVDHWLSGRRGIPYWVEKLTDYMMAHPELVETY